MQINRYATPVMSLEGHRNTIFAVAFNPLGEQVASASCDKEIKVWDLKSMRCVETFKGHGLKNTSNDKGVLSLAYSPSGTQLASGAYDNTVKVWSLDSSLSSKIWKKFLGSCQVTLGTVVYDRFSYIRAVAYCPDGSTLAAHELTQISLYDARTFKVQSTISCGYVQASFGALVYPPSGNQMASGGKKCIHIYDPRDKKICATLPESDYVVGVSYLATETSLAAGSENGNLAVWDLRASKKVNELTGHSKCITSLSYSFRRNLLVSASKDQKIKLWDTSLKCQGAVEEQFEIYSVAFSPFGAYIASGGGSAKVKIWNVSEIARSTTYADPSMTAAAAAAVDLHPIATASPASTSAKPTKQDDAKQLIYRIKTLYKEGDPVQATALCRGLAESGNVEAQCLLGVALAEGMGVEVDNEEAESWYYKASLQNHPHADFLRARHLLLMYVTEEKIVDMDQFRTALKCLTRAEQMGSEEDRRDAAEMKLNCVRLLRMVDWNAVMDVDLLTDLINELKM